MGIALGWLNRARHPNRAWAERYRRGFPEAMAFLAASQEAGEAAEREKELARQREVAQAQALAEAERLRADEQRQGARRLRKLLAAAAVIALVAVGASIFAALQTGKARRSEAAADALSSRLKTSLVQGDFASSFEKLESGDAAASLAALARAGRTDPSFLPAGMRALTTLASGRLPVQRFDSIEHEKPIEDYLHNEKHDLLLTSSEAGRHVQLWELETGLRRPPLDGMDPGRRPAWAAGAAPPDLRARLPELFAAARRIWLASDPTQPPFVARHFRKSLAIPEGRQPTRADFFVLVDDTFVLEVNGTTIGSGAAWATVFHAGVGAALVADGIDMKIRARNTQGPAALIAVVVVSFEQGDPLVVGTDQSWVSSAREDDGFTESKEWEPAQTDGSIVVEMAGRSHTMLQWSADKDRLFGWSVDEGHIVSWDVATGKSVFSPLKIPGLTDFSVSPLEGVGDVIGCRLEADGAVQVWNVRTGAAAGPKLKTDGAVTHWQFTPDGRRVVTLGGDAVIAVWETIGGAEVARISTRPIRPAGFGMDRDGRCVLAFDQSRKQVGWWEIGAAESPPVLSWIELPFAVNDWRFLVSDDAVSFIGRDDQGSVRARSFALSGERMQIADITSDPNAAPLNQLWGRQKQTNGIVGALTANAIMLWDLRTGEPFARPLVAPELLSTANLAPSGRWLVAGSATEGSTVGAAVAEKKLFVFDVFTGRLAFPRPIVLASSSPIHFTPDGGTLITMDSGAGRTDFWDVRTGRQLRAPVEGKFNNAVVSTSGKRIALYQFSRTVRGNQDLGQTTGRFSLHEAGLAPALPITFVDRSQRNPAVVASSGAARWLTCDWPPLASSPRLQHWTLDATNVHAAMNLQGDLDAATRQDFRKSPWSADGTRLVLVSAAQRISLLDTATGKAIAELDLPAQAAGAAISADGSAAAGGTMDGQVLVWTANIGIVSVRPFAEKDPLDYLEFDRTGSMLVVGNADKRSVGILDVHTRGLRFEPIQMVNPVHDIVFTADGRHLVISQNDAKLPVVDVQSGKVVRAFEFDDWTRGLDISADGRRLAVGSGANLSAASGLAYLIDMETGRRLTPPLPHAGSVMLTRFNRDGSILATATHLTPTGFGYFQLWEATTGLPLTDPVGERGAPIAIAFQPDDSAVAVSWSHGLVHVIQVPPRRPAPAWFPALAEAVAGRRLAEGTGILEVVPDSELSAIRRDVLAGSAPYADDPEWFRWVHWLFEDAAARAVSPGAAMTMARHIERLRASEDIDDLHEAVRLAPTDALTFARLASRYQATPPADLGPAKRHWDDAVVWLSDHAVELDPESVEVWTMRGELMRRLGRAELASAASAKVVALAPASKTSASPNTLYQQAMALATAGKWDEAQTAYASALDLLDEYVKQVEAGLQPLPLLGHLKRLLPTRPAATPKAGSGTGEAPVISNEPIPGAFEDFDAIDPGSLPTGWRAWNRTDPGSRPGVHHAADFQTDTWKDWAVIDRGQLEWGEDSNRRRVLMEAPPSEATASLEASAARPPPLMNGRFALAMASTRPGNQIQYLESPDFDGTGRQNIHLAFNSSWEQREQRMGIVEFSIDRGETWKPVVYYVHKPHLDEARSQYALARPGHATAGDFDVAAFLNIERNSLAWRPEPGALARRSHYGAFVAAPVDTPGLAAHFEGREAGDTEHKRREVRALVGADGAASVRLRFGSVSTGSTFWAIDSVGLYEAAGPAAAPATAAPDLKRPANDARALAAALGEILSGGNPTQGQPSNANPVLGLAMAAASSGTSAPANPAPNPSSAAANVKDSLSDIVSAASFILEPRLMAARARQLDPSNLEIRVLDAMMEMALLSTVATDEATALREGDPFVARGLERLATSPDLPADIRDTQWRLAYSLLLAIRGNMARAKSDGPEGGLSLLAVAQSLVAGSPLEQWLQAMMQSMEEGAPADGDILLKRGSVWKYFDEGRLPDEAWRQPDFDDSLWFSGAASLGYGDTPTTTVSFGPDPTNRFITTYFRTRFEVPDPEKIQSLALPLQRDDGAVVYLNGIEIARDNLPAGEISYQTLASETVSDLDEKRYFDHTATTSALRPGTNVLAVEIHQKDARSSDLAFDLEVKAARGSAPLVGAEVPPAAMAEKLKAYGIPEAIQSEFWSIRAGLWVERGDPAQASAALAQAEALGDRDESAPRRLRLRALIAQAEGRVEEADRLYTAAMEGARSLSVPKGPIDVRKFEPSLREAALALQRSRADFSFVFRRFAEQEPPQAERDLALRWAMAQAASDPAALAQVWFGLSEGLKRSAEALALAESVLGSLAIPAAGAPPEDVVQYTLWLQRKQQGLREMGNKSAADALSKELKAIPPRDPSLGPKLIDLGPQYSGNLTESFDLSTLPTTFRPLKGVHFDLRGGIQLESGTLPDGKTFNQKYNSRHPSAVQGIKIGQKSPAIHFLLSTSWGRESRGTEVARFVIRYQDGTSQTLPVRFLDDVADNVVTSSEPVAASQIGWRGLRDNGAVSELSELVWKNPSPGKAIATIDFESAQARAAPFLIAITLE
ncbi:MAG: hypothetical protein ACKV19_13100 [Verrucomicrobiales bacterium]